MEKESFIEIIKQHRSLIYKVCHSYCSDPTDRKDLEQEILLQLWKSMERFDGRVKLSTWMYKVALNTAIMFYRTHSRHKRKWSLADESVLSIPTEEKDEVYEEQVSLLYGWINQLSNPDKALILLYLDGIKQKEIAEILGITETNVSSKISRIKKKWKNRVKSI
ncbi:MAG: sigma-70 family RNA polymerase sigma factor [Bacteroidota bacterium]